MDRLDAIDALNAILRAKIKIRMEDENKDVNLIRVSRTLNPVIASFFSSKLFPFICIRSSWSFAMISSCITIFLYTVNVEKKNSNLFKISGSTNNVLIHLRFTSIQSLISTADQLLTQTKVTFSIETEKNVI